LNKSKIESKTKSDKIIEVLEEFRNIIKKGASKKVSKKKSKT